MPQPACVVAVSDSRGGGLAAFLKNSDLVQSTVVREANFPGADLHSLLSHIREESNTAYRKYPTHRIVVILFGGICSFTTKHRGRGREEIAYSSSTEKTAAIKAVYDDIWQLCKDNGYYLITTTIYPVSLEAHHHLQIVGTQPSRGQSSRRFLLMTYVRSTHTLRRRPYQKARAVSTSTRSLRKPAKKEERTDVKGLSPAQSTTTCMMVCMHDATPGCYGHSYSHGVPYMVQAGDVWSPVIHEGIHTPGNA